MRMKAMKQLHQVNLHESRYTQSGYSGGPHACRIRSVILLRESKSVVSVSLSRRMRQPRSRSPVAYTLHPHAASRTPA
jgi:hypothetical protein